MTPPYHRTSMGWFLDYLWDRWWNNEVIISNYTVVQSIEWIQLSGWVHGYNKSFYITILPIEKNTFDIGIEIDIWIEIPCIYILI